MVVAVEVEESTDFGEGKWGQASGSWFRGFGGFGWCGVVWWSPVDPPFLALCAVTARKVWARTASAVWRCQAFQVRTW